MGLEAMCIKACDSYTVDEYVNTHELKLLIYTLTSFHIQCAGVKTKMYHHKSTYEQACKYLARAFINLQVIQFKWFDFNDRKKFVAFLWITNVSKQG